MLKLTRHFATRLRGAVAGTFGAVSKAPGAPDAREDTCERLRLHLTSPHAVVCESAPAARERELVTETARRLITLVGQNGLAVVRCLRTLDTAALDNPAAALVLHLAEGVGTVETRQALAELRAGV